MERSADLLGLLVSAPHQTTWVDTHLARLRAGDPAARDALAAFATGRLEALARGMLRREFGRVGRWADTADVVQGAVLRLWRALAGVAPESPLHFHRLAARHVRHELIDLARHFYHPDGTGARHQTAGPDDPPPDPAARHPGPDERAAAADLHARVDALPADEAAVVDLIVYQGLTQEEAAGLLGVNVRTVERRWQRARRALGAMLGGPG